MAILAAVDWALSASGYLMLLGSPMFTVWFAVVRKSRSGAGLREVAESEAKPTRRATSSAKRLPEAAAEEARCRPCESMDRATLIAHVAEFSPLVLPLTRKSGVAPHANELLWLRLIRGLHTAHLLDLCTTTAGDRNRLSLPGEAAGGWSVYRIQFSDGAAYVGMTGGPVLDRIARHLDGSGSPAVGQHCVGRLEYRFDVLASGLSEQQAREREGREIRALPSPLNTMIPRPLRPPRPAIDPARQVSVEKILRRW